MKKMILILLLSILLSPIVTAKSESDVWHALKTPGAVVILRHSYAPKNTDASSSNKPECTTQRNLNAEGRAQAKAIGQAFHDKGITVGEVLSSPTCRTRDTGLLAFEHVTDWSALKGSKSNAALVEEHAEQIRQRMRQHITDKPLVLITHGSIVHALVGHTIKMGSFVVMLPNEDSHTYREAGSVHIQP